MKSKEVSDHYKSLMIISLTVGVVSTIQGLISYALLIRDLSAIATNMPFPEALSYAIFSTVYAIMISMFLLYPVHILNRDIN